MSLLKVTDLKVNYGGIKALKGITFAVKEGEIVTLIGANGAGKSTTLRSISGLVPPLTFTRPLIARSEVLFPAPFAPIRVTISPSLTAKETPLSASMPP